MHPNPTGQTFAKPNERISNAILLDVLRAGWYLLAHGRHQAVNRVF
jgi:hypothetical protein